MVAKSLWQISLTLTPRWNAVELRFCPFISTNFRIPFNRDLDCMKRQLIMSWNSWISRILTTHAFWYSGKSLDLAGETRDTHFVSRCLGGRRRTAAGIRYMLMIGPNRGRISWSHLALLRHCCIRIIIWLVFLA